MAANFVQSGGFVTIPAQGSAITAGAGVLQSSLFGIAVLSTSATEPIVLATRGVWNIAHAGGATFAVGDPVYFHLANKNAVDSSTGAREIGVAVAVQSGGAVDVLLMPTVRVLVSA